MSEPPTGEPIGGPNAPHIYEPSVAPPTYETQKERGFGGAIVFSNTFNAKWLDPGCRDGCQSLKFKAQVDQLTAALIAARKQLLERNGLDRDSDRRAAVAINIALSPGEDPNQGINPMTNEQPNEQASQGDAKGPSLADVTEIAYQARDLLQCGHVSNVISALATLGTRYHDALARMATLERELVRFVVRLPDATPEQMECKHEEWQRARPQTRYCPECGMFLLKDRILLDSSARLPNPTPAQAACKHDKWHRSKPQPRHCQECGLLMWDAGD